MNKAYTILSHIVDNQCFFFVKSSHCVYACECVTRERDRERGVGKRERQTISPKRRIFKKKGVKMLFITRIIELKICAFPHSRRFVP